MRDENQMKYIVSRLLITFSSLIAFIIVTVFTLELKTKEVIASHPVIVILLLSLAAVVVGIVIQKQTFREKNTLDFEEKYKHDEKIVPT